jgi:hypothetical protein
MNLTLKGATPTLNEQFSKLPAFRSGSSDADTALKPLSDPGFSWNSGFVSTHAAVGVNESLWNTAKKDFPEWSSFSGSGDAVPNADMIAKSGISPYLCGGNELIITPKVLTPAQKATINPKWNEHKAKYMGGAISSYPYGQKYGMFAMNCVLPKGKGAWLGSWALPIDRSWPPEMDFFEALGHLPTKLVTTLHIPNGAQIAKVHDLGYDYSTRYTHVAWDWSPKVIKKYINRVQVDEVATPASMHRPFYLIADYAVGGSWGGYPDPATKDFMPMRIDSIQAWQRPEYAGAA